MRHGIRATVWNKVEGVAMIQITAQTKSFVAIDPIDFRCGIDSLYGLIKETLKLDPYSGAIFSFTNIRRCGIKFLVYDGQGFWLMHKRLSRGKLSWWPSSPEDAIELDPKNLLLLLYNE